jgi:hypothetical protein
VRPHPVAGLILLAVTLVGCSGTDEHALGDAVDVDFYDGSGADPVGKGKVAVTEVRDGATTELEAAGYDLDPDEKAATAYYVSVTFENTGDGTVAPRPVGGEDPDGRLIHALTLLDLGGGPFEPCPGVPEEVAPGTKGEGCTIILVPPGVDLARLYYHPGGDDDFVYWEAA